MRLFSSHEEDEKFEETTVKNTLFESGEDESKVAEIVEMPVSEDFSEEESAEDTVDGSSDSLLKQIDEFRKKAEALQGLINDRQDKYNELSESLKESEERYAALSTLQGEFSLNEDTINGIADAVNSKLDIFADRIDTSVNNTVTEGIASVKDGMESELNALNKSVSSVSDSLGGSLSETLKGTNEPVMDKIHTENVRLYRNLYDFVKEDYSMENIEKLVETSVKKNRGPIGFCLFLTVVNTAILVCLVLLQLGIISF